MGAWLVSGWVTIPSRCTPWPKLSPCYMASRLAHNHAPGGTRGNGGVLLPLTNLQTLNLVTDGNGAQPQYEVSYRSRPCLPLLHYTIRRLTPTRLRRCRRPS